MPLTFDKNLLQTGDIRTLARAISIVENESDGWKDILKNLDNKNQVPVLGFTGPPGAGKSSLVNSLIGYWLKLNLKIAVIAVDPTSPFNYGSLLGDRIRMSGHFTNPSVFIRSMATRGSLGGLSEKVYETVDLIKEAGFDRIIVETVGVGQSEVEIAGLADTTIVVLVPEAGDEIQSIKSGIMEIADIFVVNKSDREGASKFAANLHNLLHERASGSREVQVIKTTATTEEGLLELAEAIDKQALILNSGEKKQHLLFEKALRLISHERMRNINVKTLKQNLEIESSKSGFNIYGFIHQNYSEK